MLFLHPPVSVSTPKDCSHIHPNVKKNPTRMPRISSFRPLRRSLMTEAGLTAALNHATLQRGEHPDRLSSGCSMKPPPLAIAPVTTTPCTTSATIGAPSPNTRGISRYSSRLPVPYPAPIRPRRARHQRPDHHAQRPVDHHRMQHQRIRIPAPLATWVQGLSLAAWLIVLGSTFLINHFELFGLHQVANHLAGSPMPQPRFRHPLGPGTSRRGRRVTRSASSPLAPISANGWSRSTIPTGTSSAR